MRAQPPHSRSWLWLPLSVALLASAAVGCGGDQTEDPAANLQADAAEDGNAVAGDAAAGQTAEDGNATYAADDPGGRRGPVLGAHVYDCQGLHVVTESQKTGALYLFLPEGTLDLPQVPSASGAQYSDGTVVFWTKGPEAMLDRGDGERLNCTENRRESVIEDAKFRGVDYWATGNEPGWRLELGPDMMLLVTNYGADEFDFPTPDPLVDSVARRTVYEVEAAGHSLRVEIRGTECFDDMSGERFETTVLLELDGKTYRGCGLALH